MEVVGGIGVRGRERNSQLKHLELETQNSYRAARLRTRQEQGAVNAAELNR